MLKVVIADDQEIMRIGLVQTLSASKDLIIVDAGVSHPDLLNKLRTTEVALIIVGMSVPNIKGIELIRRIRTEHVSLPILLFGTHSDTQIVSRAMEAGATGYVRRDSACEVMLDAIERLTTGRRFIDPNLADALVFASHADKQDPHEALSNRELQVLQMLAAGKRVSEIANEFSLSAKTVSTHKTRIMSKLELPNSAALIRYAMEHGMSTV